jgi:Ca-activated chloride channel family protein
LLVLLIDYHSLKNILSILTLFFIHFSAEAQYYFRGEVKNSLQQPITNAKITLLSSSILYSSGSGGKFGFYSTLKADTILIEVAGYERLKIGIEYSNYHQLVLQKIGTPLSAAPKLISSVRGYSAKDKTEQIIRSESYSSLAENMFVNARSHAATSVALHTDKASYSNIRRFLNKNMLIPPDAIRTDEVLNYFNLAYRTPKEGHDFHFEYQLTECPWNEKNHLLWLSLSSRKIPDSAIPPSNLVFLVDISGSMDMPNRLPMLKIAFKQLIDNLREKDTISMVVYGSFVGLWIPPTSGIEKDKIKKRIDELEPGGATPGESGIVTAYQVAKNQFIEGGNNRVIIATDGDFNVGQKNEKSLETLIGEHRDLGIYLSCLGVGMGNYKDSKLDALSKMGNGNFAYLDNLKEAEKVLVKELTKTLYTIGDNAALTIEFNADQVADYRLIGYENRERILKDTQAVFEGGEIGPGHTSLVVFELTLDDHTKDSKLPLAEVNFQYMLPYDSTVLYNKYPVSNQVIAFNKIPREYQLLTNLTIFTQLLKQNKYVPRMKWNDIYKMAEPLIDKEDQTEVEYLFLLDKTRKIYNRYKGDLRKHWNK